ncbi:phosphonate C-P lyase system protein PhnL [Oceanimonas baumannii]|uniref:phosphonate C-P lyase system protein PhnL n=1 Tax=Oceanimonas baumannii TaxID=129578 RepID=UPI003A91890C
MTFALKVSDVHKTFVLHNQNGIRLPVLSGASLNVAAGECVVLHGRSGSGKSTLLRTLYGNYLTGSGQIEVRHQEQWLDMTQASPRDLVNVRRQTIGWVSQFLRVIPRISALEVVMQPMIEQGGDRAEAKQRAEHLLTRLNVPEHLWQLAPATFSGGEQQRVNIARGFIADYPVLLLDEPTASLDAANRAVVVELIHEAKARGAAIVGIFHDEDVREQVADRLYDIQSRVDGRPVMH